MNKYCKRCGKALHDPSSIKKGYGAYCMKKLKEEKQTTLWQIKQSNGMRRPLMKD